VRDAQPNRTEANFSSVSGGRDSADVAGACSAAKFVVEGAGAEYDAPHIEPNRESRLINAPLILATMSTAIRRPSPPAETGTPWTLYL
jgi:hypothetical protein